MSEVRSDIFLIFFLTSLWYTKKSLYIVDYVYKMYYLIMRKICIICFLLCDYIKEICRQFIVMFPALEQNLGGHKFKRDREIETVVTRCLITAIKTGSSEVRLMIR
jgi:hypothetical protein